MIERAVARDPGRRYPSAGGLIEAARERQGAAPAATRVLSDAPDRPTPGIGQRLGSAAVPASAAGGRADRRRRSPIWLSGRTGRLGGSDRRRPPVPRRRRRLRLGADRGRPGAAASGRRRDAGLGDEQPPTAPSRASTRRRGGASASRCASARGVSGVAVGAGSVWVSSPRTRRGPADRSGVAGSARARIDVGGRPGPIVFGGERVWVADGSGARRDRDQRGRAAGSSSGGIAPHSAPLRLAVGAGGPLGQQRLDRRGAPHRPRQRRGRAADPRRPRARGDHRRRRASSGSPTAAPTASPGSTRRPGRCSASRSRSAAGRAASTPAPRRSGSRTRRTTRVSRIDIESGEPVGDPVGVGAEPRRRRGRRGSGLGCRQRRRTVTRVTLTRTPEAADILDDQATRSGRSLSGSGHRPALHQHDPHPVDRRDPEGQLRPSRDADGAGAGSPTRSGSASCASTPPTRSGPTATASSSPPATPRCCSTRCSS